jgi:hypothetical protein
MRAAGCYAADDCVMDPECPFYAGCKVAEDRSEPVAVKSSATYLVPQALLEDYAGMGDVLVKAMRGEIQLNPVRPPWHRCLFCWLLAKFPGHDRCEHGRLTCDDCYDDC